MSFGGSTIAAIPFSGLFGGSALASIGAFLFKLRGPLLKDLLTDNV